MSEYTEHADRFLVDTGTKLNIVYDGCDYYFDDDKSPRDIYKCRLKRGGRQYSFRFGQSIAAMERGESPTAYDILSCLTKYEPEGDVWDFASEYGYEIHDRKSYDRVNRTFKAVNREWRGVNRLFEDVLEQLAEIS